MQRRDFFKKSLFAVASLSVLGTVIKTTTAFAKELIDMTGKSKNPANKAAVNQAKGLNYVADLEKAIKEGKVEKKDKKVGDKTYKISEQLCSTCMFYKEEKPGQGPCTLIPGVLVHGKGHCTSWTPKPA